MPEKASSKKLGDTVTYLVIIIKHGENATLDKFEAKVYFSIRKL